ncbi:MAG: hypothetical protein JJ866_17750 [Roseibium sp.]|uniref:hypothetical protein n=1 Tax=Roseibium sp. TaxID=1936156 RepID=UPI001B273772|nr:hypothetical protein [Roseibium sp.]MBO6893789.1 hypothetical protein [Roseibium sp.]MBO6930258.1 hypothetical protein [Roseibium sp.]
MITLSFGGVFSFILTGFGTHQTIGFSFSVRNTARTLARFRFGSQILQTEEFACKRHGFLIGIQLAQSHPDLLTWTEFACHCLTGPVVGPLGVRHQQTMNEGFSLSMIIALFAKRFQSRLQVFVSNDINSSVLIVKIVSHLANSGRQQLVFVSLLHCGCQRLLSIHFARIDIDLAIDVSSVCPVKSTLDPGVDIIVFKFLFPM